MRLQLNGQRNGREEEREGDGGGGGGGCIAPLSLLPVFPCQWAFVCGTAAQFKPKTTLPRSLSLSFFPRLVLGHSFFFAALLFLRDFHVSRSLDVFFLCCDRLRAFPYFGCALISLLVGREGNQERNRDGKKNSTAETSTKRASDLDCERRERVNGSHDALARRWTQRGVIRGKEASKDVLSTLRLLCRRRPHETDCAKPGEGRGQRRTNDTSLWPPFSSGANLYFDRILCMRVFVYVTVRRTIASHRVFSPPCVVAGCLSRFRSLVPHDSRNPSYRADGGRNQAQDFYKGKTATPKELPLLHGSATAYQPVERTKGTKKKVEGVVVRWSGETFIADRQRMLLLPYSLLCHVPSHIRAERYLRMHSPARTYMWRHHKRETKIY